MLQNSFYEGVQRETKAVVEGHLEETYHLGHLDHVGSQNVGRPDLDTKRGPITPCESCSIQRLDSARSHCQSILHDRLQIFRSPGVFNLINSPLTLVRGWGFPRGVSKNTPIIRGATRPSELETAEESNPMCNEEERPGPMRIIGT